MNSKIFVFSELTKEKKEKEELMKQQQLIIEEMKVLGEKNQKQISGLQDQINNLNKFDFSHALHI